MRKKLFRVLLAAAGIGIPLLLPAQIPEKQTMEELQLQFHILKHGNYGEGRVTGNRGNGFSMSLKNTARRNHVIAFANVKRATAAQEKLVFRLSGSKNNGNAFLSVELLYDRGGKWVTVRSPSLPLRGEALKTHVFGLDTDFKLGDGVYLLRQIKFILNGDANPRGSRAAIRVEDVRIVSADALSSSGGEFVVLPVPAPPSNRRGIERPLKVWFELDNDDRSPLVRSRVSHGVFQDRISPWSYRGLLLEHAENLIADAKSPEEADVIVYARAGKSASAARIAKRVAEGARLIVYGKAADPEISALLPVTLAEVSRPGLPLRSPLTVRNAKHPLFRSLKLTSAAPGVYFCAEPKKGAGVLLSFADGSAFLTERGGVLHVNGGIGCRLDESESVFYDRFLLQALALSSKELAAALDRRDREVRQEKRSRERKRILAALKAAGIPAEEAEGWRLGLSEENMGRFGWLIGEPLLTDTVGKDLTVSNETQQYGFAFRGISSVSFPVWKL